MVTKQQQGPRYELDVHRFFTQSRQTKVERHALGEAQRAIVPLEQLAAVPAKKNRADALSILHGQDTTREQWLVPLRYERMGMSAFTFLRGAAGVMASDLSKTPNSGISVQLCGDAHLNNFGLFASHDRSLVFDINDFDETLPGPFDWDVKRLAASVAVAALDSGASKKKARSAAHAAATTYRNTMSVLMDISTMDVWNLRVDTDVLAMAETGKSLREATARATRKSMLRTSETATAKLTTMVDGKRRFRSDPPILIPLRDEDRESATEVVELAYAGYLKSLPADRVALLGQYSLIDLAHKVVGVGSVGTRAYVLLLEDGDGNPLVLQVKEAAASVLEKYVGNSYFANHGQRVVVGQQVLQTTGDPLLGWVGGAEFRYDFYVRQLKDLKGAIDVARLTYKGLFDYARVCGVTLARAHARVGDPAMVSGYLGDDDTFDLAIADFSMEYARINASDYAQMKDQTPSPA